MRMYGVGEVAADSTVGERRNGGRRMGRMAGGALEGI